MCSRFRIERRTKRANFWAERKTPVGRVYARGRLYRNGPLFINMSWNPPRAARIPLFEIRLFPILYRCITVKIVTLVGALMGDFQFSGNLFFSLSLSFFNVWKSEWNFAERKSFLTFTFCARTVSRVYILFRHYDCRYEYLQKIETNEKFLLGIANRHDLETPFYGA